MRQADRLVDRHLGRDLSPPELEDAEPQDVPLHHGHPAHPPVLRGPGGLGVERFQVGHHGRSQLLRPIQDPGERTRTVLKWLNLLLPPGLVLIYGLLRVQWRRRQRKQRMKSDHVR